MTLLLLGVTIGIPKAMKDKKIIYSRQYAFESRCFFLLDSCIAFQYYKRLKYL